MVGTRVMEQSTCRKFSCWLARKFEAGGGVAQSFARDIEGLESGLSCWVAGHSLFGPVYVVTGCVSEFHWVVGLYKDLGLDGTCNFHGLMVGMG